MSSDNNTQEQESFSFVETEKSVLSFWNEQSIFQKSLDKTKNSKSYVFYDGPPFATGLPHHGHLVASTLKDIVPRYFTMKGRYVSRRFGWDCHGLPIEQEIDKQFGMSAADYVEKNGVAKYNHACRGIVQRYTKEWEKTISRLGRWVDFEDDYKTMDLNFMESVWWVFKSCWDKKLIYKGNKIVPYSTALQTGLSNFEATSNYQDVQDPAVTVLMKQTGEDKYFAAWTTTPWTLPSNLGLCVNSEVDYVLAHSKKLNKDIYFAEARLEFYNKKGLELEVKENLKGSDLSGLEYEPLFNYYEEHRSDGCFKVFTDDYVTTTDGTGIVHQAPAFGEDDNRVMKAAGVNTIVCPIDESGKFWDVIADFKGQYIKDADKEIIKHLKSEDKLIVQDVLVHSYPFCPRTDTPLIYRALPQWYLSVDTVKEKMVAANQQINWVPEHIKDGRFGKWLEGARDWAISRNRFWGTPLPIWENQETGNFICIGSVEELAKYTGTTVDDLHRETVDDMNFKVEGEAGEYQRISEVLDCWFESGSMPYAQLHYPFENKDAFENGFPAEYIAEGLDQTRGWFYTLTVLSAALFDKPAFKNVIVNGMVLAEDGRKMSKRLKNYTAPDDLMEKHGADALRLFLINSGLVKGEELRFTDDGVKDMVRRVLLPWYNSFKFFNTYAKVDGWDPTKNFVEGENITDRWVLSKLQTLIKNVTHEMDNYRLYNVVPALFNFIEDLTNWYIRLNRRRFWEDGLSDDKCAAYSTLYTTLKNISILMAPFTPFLSDHIHLELKKFNEISDESVHLCDYPTANENVVDSTLEDAVERMQQIILLGRQKRNQVQIKVKTPMQRLTIIHQDQNTLDEIKKLETYIQTELNIKDIEYSINESEFIKLFAKPNSPILGKRLGKQFGKFMGKIKGLKSDQLAQYEASGSMEIDGEKFTGDDIFVLREALEGTEAISNSKITIDMDVNLSDSLLNEGLAREVVNRIQKSRKDLNFNVEDRITIVYSANDKLNTVIDSFKDYIQKETLCSSLSAGTVASNENSLNFTIDDNELTINLTR